MPSPSLPMMPMKLAADEVSEAPSPLPPPPMGPPPEMPTAVGATGMMPPPMPPGGAGMPPGGAMPPQGPAAPPYETTVQSDGSIVAFITDPMAPDGKRIIGVHKPFKIPQGMQQQQPPAGTPMQ